MKTWRPPPKFYDERDILIDAEAGGDVARLLLGDGGAVEPEFRSWW